ncbi:hypothetical protein BOTBODRAFT_444825 [Botryobasidium botryosum FD-172 SS1]|uniref:Uncharacterized protein n=1 Tax=Botryobasidium botryosum (strain FD-172 SS1) TaxID=930990 RepID=A0A067N682_BOTB1|nr:hypothetical protein BOTBODRAFT_444825 [Botryobasidium botryosum FD-172 SS1]
MAIRPIDLRSPLALASLNTTMSILALPVEIIIDILPLACSDVGQTAQNLCLVSRYFYALAKPLRFRSIAVFGVDALRAFGAHLLRYPEIPPTMRHLLLSERAKSSSESDRQSQSQIAPINNILALASPYLETLCCLCFSQDSVNCIRVLYMYRWPRLVELTIQGHTSIQFYRDPFPSLQRLHLHTHYLSRWCDHWWEETTRLSSIYPKLTHLKLTGLGAEAWYLGAALMEAWGTVELDEQDNVVPNSRDRYGSMRLKLPLHLRCIIIQPVRWPSYMGESGYARMLRHLKTLAKTERLRGLVIEKETPLERHHERAEVDWLDRQNGGRGCWMKEGDGVTVEEARKSIDADECSSSDSDDAKEGGPPKRRRQPHYVSSFSPAVASVAPR